MIDKSFFRTDLGARIVTAVPLSLLAALLIWLGGWPLAAFIALGCGAMGWEWQGMTAHRGAGNSVHSKLAIAVAGLQPLLAYGFCIPVAVGIGAALAAVLAFLETGPTGRPIWVSLGAFIIGLIGACFIWLRGDAEYGIYIAFWIPLVVACADMGGYFAGRAIGGPKLAPSISPNKTISGALGGLVLAVIFGSLFAVITGVASVPLVAVLSLIIAMVSQCGDLAESAVKRHFGVKDASDLIPGHGGVLDRLDAMLLATLAVAIITALRGQAIFAW